MYPSDEFDESRLYANKIILLIDFFLSFIIKITLHPLVRYEMNISHNHLPIPIIHLKEELLPLSLPLLLILLLVLLTAVVVVVLLVAAVKVGGEFIHKPLLFIALQGRLRHRGHLQIAQ